jgi:hypothetical protein
MAEEDLHRDFRFTFGFEYFVDDKGDHSVPDEFYSGLGNSLLTFYKKVMIGKYKGIVIPEDEDDQGIEKFDDKKLLWKADPEYESRFFAWMDIHLKLFHCWSGNGEVKPTGNDTVAGLTRVNFVSRFKSTFLERRNPFREAPESNVPVDNIPVEEWSDPYSHDRWTLAQDMILDYFLEEIKNEDEMILICELKDKKDPRYQRAIHMMLCFLSMNRLFTKYICVEGKLSEDHIKNVFVERNCKYLYTTPPSMEDNDNPLCFNRLLNSKSKDGDFIPDKDFLLLDPLDQYIRFLSFDSAMDKHLWLFYREKGTRLAQTKPSHSPFLFVPTLLKLRESFGSLKALFDGVEVKVDADDARRAEILIRRGDIEKKVEELTQTIAKDKVIEAAINKELDEKKEDYLELNKKSIILARLIDFGNKMKGKIIFDVDIWENLIYLELPDRTTIARLLFGDNDNDVTEMKTYMDSKSDAYWENWNIHQLDLLNKEMYHYLGLENIDLMKVIIDRDRLQREITNLRKELLRIDNRLIIVRNQLELELKSMPSLDVSETVKDAERERFLKGLFTIIQEYKFPYRRTLHQPHRNLLQYHKYLQGPGITGFSREKLDKFKSIPKQDPKFYYAILSPDDLERGIKNIKDSFVIQKYERITNSTHPEAVYYQIVDNFDRKLYKPDKNGRAFPIRKSTASSPLEDKLREDPFCGKYKHDDGFDYYHHILGPFVRYPYAPEIVLPILTKDHKRPYLLQEVLYPVRLFMTGEKSLDENDEVKDLDGINNSKVNPKNEPKPRKKQKTKSKFPSSGVGSGVGVKRKTPDPVTNSPLSPTPLLLPVLDNMLLLIPAYKELRNVYYSKKFKPQDPLIPNGDP